ncbi:hypothetical protein BDZ97DRAFT_1829146 [Flammula alnicola]|nr:hypothetical protein BDZ97DRAFT_1829146 [Flammula alnicola]
MDDHRAQTLQALEAFIQTQRIVLARQRSDIERLQRLKVDLVQRPSQVLENLGEELDDRAFRLSEHVDCRLKLPKEIDWSAFEKADTGPLRTFAQRTRDEIAQRNQPFPAQRSDLSELQKLVKHARLTIVDPILLRFENIEEEVDPVELKRQQERQKIRELKQRQIRGCGLSLPLSSLSGSMGVFIRNDVEDEAMDADVMIDDDDQQINKASRVPPKLLGKNASPITPAVHSFAAAPSETTPSTSGARTRRPTTKAASKLKKEDEDTLLPSDAPGPRKKLKTLNLPPKPDMEDEAPKESKSSRDTGKPKPETYKQAWSVSEQNLLEQLLEQIPEGEKFRWQKISKAMGGRRTPRQVASRVQKYFEKLKKFSLL